MKMINAIITSCLFSGVAVGQDMDTMSLVQIEAATHASLNDNHLSLNVGGFVQTGWEYSNGGGLPAQNGFAVDRARLTFSGDMSNESFSYLVSGEWSDVTNSFDLLDAVVTLRMFDEANIRVGQFVPQFYAGFVTDPTQLTTLNYSVSALTFGQGRGTGVEVFRSFGDFEVSGFYNNGFDTAGAGVGDNNYAIGVAATYHVDAAVSLNGGWAYDSVTEGVNSLTFGGVYAEGPLSIGADWIVNDDGGSLNNWSIVTTAAYKCFDDFEGFAQWELGDYDGSLNLLTVGGNYDLAHGLVWTNTLGYALQSLGNNFVTDNTGWRAGSDSGQFVLRSSVTLSF
jgi:hypothetical protein